MKRHGFTIVELIVVIAIMGTLIVMGVVNMRDSQMNARDTERKNDVESLALQLEIFYSAGSPISSVAGRYPATTELIGNELDLMRDLTKESLNAPGYTTSVLIPATNNIQSISGVLPVVNTNTYVYQPITAEGELCTLSTQECRKFNLYYATEADGNTNLVQSKNQ